MLIKCSECGKDVSTKAKHCMNCGAPPSAVEDVPLVEDEAASSGPDKGSKSTEKKFPKCQQPFKVRPSAGGFLSWKCLLCGAGLRCSEESAGQILDCPNCGEPIRYPDLDLSERRGNAPAYCGVLVGAVVGVILASLAGVAQESYVAAVSAIVFFIALAMCPHVVKHSNSKLKDFFLGLLCYTLVGFSSVIVLIVFGILLTLLGLCL